MYGGGIGGALWCFNAGRRQIIPSQKVNIMADRLTKVVRFPRKKIRRRLKNASAVGTTAPVFAIPTSRHRKIVAFIAFEMQAQGTLEAAEEYLAGHLSLEFGRLETLGIPEAEAEDHCREFARAAWRAVFLKTDTFSTGEDVA